MVDILERAEQLKREEEEEKMQRIDAFREKKRLEKQREKDKLVFTERMKKLQELAMRHYQRSLLKWRGVYAFKKLITLARSRMEQAQRHHELSIQWKWFDVWQTTIRSSLLARYDIADEFNNYRVVKRSFLSWTRVKDASHIQLLKAARHREHALTLKIVRAWADYAADEKIAMWRKERISKEHNIERIKKKYFRRVRKFPEIRVEEEEREKRREKMRKKVSHLLVDYDGLSKSQSQDHS